MITIVMDWLKASLTIFLVQYNSQIQIELFRLAGSR